MGKFTEKDIERLNHAQLCEILEKEGVQFSTEETKAELRARILLIEESETESPEVEEIEETPEVEEVEDASGSETPASDAIASAINARRELRGVEKKTIEQQIAERRAQFTGKGRVMSVNAAIAARRRKL